MKLNNIINEAPLPDDWDKSVFSDNVPFTQRIRYAKERAKQVGRGSSRVAFETPYEGRKTVLKIALNTKGMVQNEEEANLLSDWYLKGIDITIPMIDYDEQSNKPTWVHTEYADKITQKKLESFFEGVSMLDIANYLNYHRVGNKSQFFATPKLPDELYENEYFQALQDLVINLNIPPNDLTRKANWGLYKGHPVIIDLGLTEVSAKLYR